MWSVKRVAGSNSKWIVYKDNLFKGTVCILDDAQFYGNVEVEGESDEIGVINHVEELILKELVEEEMLMDN